MLRRAPRVTFSRAAQAAAVAALAFSAAAAAAEPVPPQVQSTIDQVESKPLYELVYADFINNIVLGSTTAGAGATIGVINQDQSTMENAIQQGY